MAYNKPDELKKEPNPQLIKAQHQYLRQQQHAHYGTTDRVTLLPPAVADRLKTDVTRILGDSGYKFDRVEDHWLFDGLVRVLNADPLIAVPPVFDCDEEVY